MKKLLLAILILCTCIIMFSCSKEDSQQEQQMEESHLPEIFNALTNVFGDSGVGAAVWLGDDVTMLFDMNGTEYVWIENGEIMDRQNVGNDSSLMKKAPFTGVNACVTLGTRVYYFAGGKAYSNMSYDKENVKGGWNNPDFFEISNFQFLLEQWGDDGSCPFESVRAVMSWHPDRNCSDEYEFGDWVTMFDFNSSNCTFYGREKVRFYSPVANENYSQYDCLTNEKIGLGLNTIIDAACVYVVDGVPYELFFFNGGETFVYSQVGSPDVSEYLSIKTN